MTKKHVKRYSSSPNQGKTNRNKIKHLIFAHNIGQKEEQDFYDPVLTRAWKKAFFDKVGGSVNWYSSLGSDLTYLSNFKIYHLGPRNPTSKNVSHRIPSTVT